VKLKNIITESLIDDLSISKINKKFLKLIDKLYRVDQKSDGIVYLELKDLFSYLSNQEIFNLIHFYKDYGDILFKDVSTNLEDDKGLDINKFPQIYLVILLKYIEDNYKGKSIYKTDKLDYTLEFLESIEDMIYEELDGFLLYDINTQTSLFLGLIPSEKGIGYDFLIYDDEFYGYFDEDEIIQSGFIPVPKVKNILSEQGLKNNVDYILNYLVYNVIQPNEVGLNEISDLKN
jgi:hypothetical protein